MELNTFGHALCALLIYLLWWEKPFEVDYPTMIQSENLWGFQALDWMNKNPSTAVDGFNKDLLKWYKKNFRYDDEV